jgi:hypothetical protein
MKIASSNITLDSDSSQQMVTMDYEYLRSWNGSGATTATSKSDIVMLQSTQSSTTVEISDQAQNLFHIQLQQTDGLQQFGDAMPSDPWQLRNQLLQMLIKAVTGKQINLLSLNPNWQLATQNQSVTASSGFKMFGSALFNRPISLSLGRGLDFHRYQLHSESESTAFSAQGTVKTVDGKEINLQLGLTMSRSFVSENKVDIQGRSVLKDPLVINYGGAAASLTERKFSFDIDSDGTADQISFLNQGSGFLALDKNGDGKIDNGSELFGTQSGNGFADLATSDVDHNGWIDENDPIYDKLRIWSKDASGKDQLLALGQAGVGAIYLGSAASQFSLKDGANQLDGQIRSSGIFLRDDGTSGTVQQVDLVV